MSADDELERARYARMRWNAPLSEAHAADLVRRLSVAPSGSVLDLGCGWGELLIRAVTAGGEGATGVGVDTDAALLERGRASARERGVADRVTFVQAPAQTWAEPADRVICIGSTHVWGETPDALRALDALVAPGGRLLFGDGCWDRPPTDAATAIFGDGVLALPELVGCATDAGWRVLDLTTADLREWDEFEGAWRLGREEWLLAHPDAPQASELRDQLRERLAEYVSDYRGVLGFCYLVLAR